MTDTKKTGNLVQVLHNEDGTTDMLIDTGEDAKDQSGLKIFKNCYPVEVEIGEGVVIDGLRISCTFNYQPQQKMVDVVWPGPEGGRGGHGGSFSSVTGFAPGDVSVVCGAGGASSLPVASKGIPAVGYGSFDVSFDAEPVSDDTLDSLRKWEEFVSGRVVFNHEEIPKPSLFMRFCMWAAYANWIDIGMLSAFWAVVVYGFYLAFTVPKVPL